MKIVVIAVVILLVLFVTVQLFAMSNRKNIESYSYTVVKTYNEFEIRLYEAALFTSVNIPSSNYNDASSQGFSILAGYIFGKNDRKEKISMTSPVAMTLDDTITMMFMVPKKFNKASLPKPDESSIRFIDEPAKQVAVLQFGGWANNQKINKYKEKLKSALTKAGVSHTDKFYFLGYNPPYDLINRRNEIMVEISSEI
ncbi:MAG: soul heme-binding protein [Flavobacteriales bacterium]|nr:soul heme-binding protein [Flavobacteriales bacterium]|tara:strand:- start:8391 stop:8984 length:594 start_codon:yes stop_codon:yes gene_type:complete